MNNKTHLKPLAAALIAAGLVTAVPPATAALVNEEVTLQAGRTVTPADERVISSAAGKVLRHIAQARADLHGDKPDPEAAQTHIDHARSLLDIIGAVAPTTQVKDRIWVAQKHLEYQNTEEVLPDLVPIYASLEELVEYLPTAKAKAHVDEAKQALEEGDKKGANEALEAADDALLYVEMDLPLSSTRQLVAQASADLAKGDNQAAEQALARAEDNVVFLSVTFDAPLTHARAALWRARQSYAIGETEAAKADLGAAVRYLGEAAKSEDPRTRDDAAALLTQVRSLSADLETNGEGVGDRLEHTWARTKALSERAAEQIATGWQRLRAADPAKSDLIDAKLYLTYAGIDQFTAKDGAAAKVDIAEAQGHLDAALEAATPAVQEQVRGIRDQVDTLAKAMDSEQGAATRQGFEQARADLARLIRTL
jgi:hypothetical protein